jgi:predicted neuraminidase
LDPKPTLVEKMYELFEEKNNQIKSLIKMLEKEKNNHKTQALEKELEEVRLIN